MTPTTGSHSAPHAGETLPQPQSSALPVPRSASTHASHAAVDIPGASSHRSGGGVFDGSPSWGASSSWLGTSEHYGASPLIGTPFPYLVRNHSRSQGNRLHTQGSHTLDHTFLSGLPAQAEGDEGREGEAAVLGRRAAASPPAQPLVSQAIWRDPSPSDHCRLPSTPEARKWVESGSLTEPLLGAKRDAARAPAPSTAAHNATAAAVQGAGGAGGGGFGRGEGGEALQRQQAEAVVGGAKGVGSGAQREAPPTPLSRSLVFGAINSIATIPTLIAFAAIVFKDPVYAPYLDLLCKFFFLSSALHQTVFCLMSSLPYAIGQVQDVGLIFLSAMASSIAVLCAEAQRDAATALGTSLLTMTVCTFLVGLGTLAVARFRLAGLVQYLPLPVVGGYLGFVGYFCIASGIGLGCGVDIGSIPSWLGLASWDALLKLLPTLGSCAAMMLTLEHVTHPLGLPAVMTAIVLAFHAALLAAGVSLERAQETGWAMPATKGNQQFWELWGLFNIHGFSLEGIFLPAAFKQIGKFFGLFLVVCFGSCMDIAAIQQDTPQKIDFDKELTTVAVANMAVGVAGCGYTGSYIFSQTVFTMRAGVFSRWNGVVVAVSELALFALPFSVVQYMPNFFFGALLLWFGIEISRDWLLLSFRKLTITEYVLLWLTFGTIMQLGLELGIGVGILMAVLYFSYAYAKSQVSGLGFVHLRSGVVRTLDQQAALGLFDGRLVTARLRGFVFFGSANSIGIKLHQAAEEMVGEGRGSGCCGLQRTLSAQLALDHSRRSVGEGYKALKLAQAKEALGLAPRYIIIDFTHVTGMDATGARTFGMLFRDLQDLQITPLVTGIRDRSCRQLLEAHGVPLRPLHWPPPLPAAGAETPTPTPLPAPGLTPAPGPTAVAASPFQGHDVGAGQGGSDGVEGGWGFWECGTLEEGLRYCEDKFLEVGVECGLCPPPSARITLEALLRSHLPNVPFAPATDPSQLAHNLLQHLGRRLLAAGECLWRPGEEAGECYIIEKGSVRLTTYREDSLGLLREGAGDGAAGPSAHAGDGVVVSTHEHGPGCVVGALDLYLHRPRASLAVVVSQGGARLFRLSNARLATLAAEAPQALNLIQAVLMRAVCRDLAVAMEMAAGQREIGGNWPH